MKKTPHATNAVAAIIVYANKYAIYSVISALQENHTKPCNKIFYMNFTFCLLLCLKIIYRSFATLLIMEQKYILLVFYFVEISMIFLPNIL